MSRLARSVLHLARFTLEAKTALSIGTGGSDGVFDHPIVRDANGLPQIPGSSLAGVLRHLWTADHPDVANKNDDDQQKKVSARDDKSDDKADALFGFQFRDQGHASRLEVAACALQDSTGQPVEGLLLEPQQRRRLKDDRLLAAALTTREDPNFRDRVRLSHRGVAVRTGKFDRGLLLAGYRFSGELRLWSTQKDDPDWEAVLALLNDSRLRLGGGTRAGLGAMTLKKLHRATFDLKNADDIKRFQNLSPSLGVVRGLEQMKIPTPALAAGVQQLSITLKPKDFWRIGQGDAPLGNYPDNAPTLLPKAEKVVIWTANGAEISKQRAALMPGSSVKGALAHRTAFYWNALAGQFVDKMTPEEIKDWDKSEHCDGVKALFGYAKDREKNQESAEESKRNGIGQVGQVIIDDVYLPDPPVASMIHNSIDRFTGGVRDRMLFTEELLHQAPLRLVVMLLPGVENADPLARQAFARALADLGHERLALGGGVTKGHGTFIGTPDQATQDWLLKQGESWQ